MKTKLKLSKLLNCLPQATQEALRNLEGFSVDDPELEVKRLAAVAEIKKLETGERAVERYVSTRDVDRDTEVLDPQGAVLDQFKLAPQVLWAHNYAEPPIGKAEWIRADEYGLKSKTIYAETERAEEVWQLIQGGFLKTASVGFIPIKRIWKGDVDWGATVAKYNAKWDTDLENAGATAITTKWLLLEYSDVPVPANINALTYAVAKSLQLSEGLIDQLGIEPENAESDPATAQIEEGNPAEKPYPNEHACRLRDPGHDGTFEAASGEEDALSDPCAQIPIVRHIEAPTIDLSGPTKAGDSPVVRRVENAPIIAVRRIAPTMEQQAARAAEDALNQLRGRV